MLRPIAVVVNWSKNGDTHGDTISQIRSILRIPAVTASETKKGLAAALNFDMLFLSRILEMLYQIKS